MHFKYKKYFVLATLLLGLNAFGFLIIEYFSSNEYGIKDPEKISELPFKVAFNKKKSSNLIIIIFTSTCEDCQNKAQQIRKHIKGFEQTRVLLISPEDSASIIKFAIQYQLNNLSNVRFLQVTKEKIFKTFATTTVPYILVYNHEGNLNKELKGDIKIEKLLEIVK
jgi:thioredoxin-related protein